MAGSTVCRLGCGFIIIPLILILYYAFTGEEGGFTLSNFAYVATKENIKALGLALWLSLLSTALCLLLAYPLAMILANRNVNQTSFIVLIFILPMWMNFLLRTLAWQTLLEKNGVINSTSRFSICPGLPSTYAGSRSFSVWCITSCRLWFCRSTMFCNDRP